MRLRAPSESTSDSSDAESDDADDFTLLEPAKAVPTLSAVSRQDLLRRVERSCEKRALDAVTASAAYLSLCDTLKNARIDAERHLDHALQRQDAPIQSTVRRKHAEMEAKAKEQLEQVRGYNRRGKY